MAACVADLVKCSLCLGEFEDPRALPCLDTFCLDCLVQQCAINQQDDMVKCPMCKEYHIIPHGFRKDFRMNSFMAINKTDELHVRVTMCELHPRFELAHCCVEVDCKQAVVCAECITQNHQNHQIIPMKGIFEAKLSHLTVMKQAIEQNHQLVESVRKKLEDNRCEMLDTVKTQIKQLEKEIVAVINHKANSIQHALTVKAADLEEAEDQLEALETEFSNTIPNIVRNNADKHLDTDFHCLHETLSNWSLHYRMMKVAEFSDLNLFTKKKNAWVRELPEQAVKGVRVALFGFAAPSVEAEEIVTWCQRDRDIRDVACHPYGGGGVTIVSSSHLRMYKLNGKMFHSTGHKDNVHRLSTFGRGYHAVLERRNNVLWQLHCSLPRDLIKIIDECKEQGTLDVGFGISGTENYVLYSASEKDSKNSHVFCYSVGNDSLEYLWGAPVAVMPSCLSALEMQEKLFVVVANCFSDAIPAKNATALFALNSDCRKKSLWKITFEALDREAEKFNLRDMCNDGRYFYVLNTMKGCVYMVSIHGNVLSKILQNLQKPKAISCNSKTGDLIVACEDRRVSVYKLVYKER